MERYIIRPKDHHGITITITLDVPEDLTGEGQDLTGEVARIYANRAQWTVQTYCLISTVEPEPRGTL